MQIKEGYNICLLNVPDGFEQILKPLPEGVGIDREMTGEYDMILMFVQWQKDLEPVAPGLKEHMQGKEVVWLAYPKTTLR